MESRDELKGWKAGDRFKVTRTRRRAEGEKISSNVCDDLGIAHLGQKKCIQLYIYHILSPHSIVSDDKTLMQITVQTARRRSHDIPS